MHAISSYRGNRHTSIQTGPITIHSTLRRNLARSVIKGKRKFSMDIKNVRCNGTCGYLSVKFSYWESFDRSSDQARRKRFRIWRHFEGFMEIEVLKICRKIWGSGSVKWSRQTVSAYTLCQWFPNSQQSRVRFLTVCRRLEKLVLPFIFDTNLSFLMMWNLQSYTTTVLNERMWHY